jgi:hypothetical protein
VVKEERISLFTTRGEIPLNWTTHKTYGMGASGAANGEAAPSGSIVNPYGRLGCRYSPGTNTDTGVQARDCARFKDSRPEEFRQDYYWHLLDLRAVGVFRRGSEVKDKHLAVVVEMAAGAAELVVGPEGDSSFRMEPRGSAGGSARAEGGNFFVSRKARGGNARGAGERDIHCNVFLRATLFAIR